MLLQIRKKKKIITFLSFEFSNFNLCCENEKPKVVSEVLLQQHLKEKYIYTHIYRERLLQIRQPLTPFLTKKSELEFRSVKRTHWFRRIRKKKKKK